MYFKKSGNAGLENIVDGDKIKYKELMTIILSPATAAFLKFASRVKLSLSEL